MFSTSRIRSTLLLTLLVAALSACTPEQPQPETEAGTEVVLETEDDKTIYAMGVNLAQNLDHLALSKSEQEVLQQGFADGLLKREPQVDTVRYGRRVESLFARRNADLAQEESEAAEAFLAEAAAVEGAQQSDSGMVMVVLTPGDGPSPGPTDRVRVHYHGTLRDGTVFDSSVVRGEPAVFPLNRVIPCWTEALQKMKTGEKSRVICPAHIAYGDRGAPPVIKPGATLAFEVELLEILQ
jgi:FKBP-type peptidyl-prolyl cis-trans isomerase FkpA/FKBP-type peptidyl-prolyl cis-trans isomerase FklB